MHPLRSVVLVATACAVIAAGVPGPTTLPAAGQSAGAPAADPGATRGGAGRPSGCAATPGLSFTGGWRATTEDRYDGVRHQCTWSVGAAGAVVATVTSVVIPRPADLPATGVAAFAVLPCDGDACLGATPGLQRGAFARGIRPSADSAALFFDNREGSEPDGRRHAPVEAEAWVLTDDNLCLSDLDVALVGYDAAVVDTLLVELRANAAGLCGVGA